MNRREALKAAALVPIAITKPSRDPAEQDSVEHWAKTIKRWTACGEIQICALVKYGEEPNTLIREGTLFWLPRDKSFGDLVKKRDEMTQARVDRMDAIIRARGGYQPWDPKG